VSVRDLWNIAGRAGRANVETEGHIILLETNSIPRVMTNYYLDQRNVKPIRSQLWRVYEYLAATRLSDHVLDLDLAALDNVEVGDKAFLTRFDSQLLATLVEEIIGTDVESDLEKLLSTTLFGTQALRLGTDTSPVNLYAKDRIGAIRARISDPSKRMAYYRTGLAIPSCEHLEVLVSEFLESHGVSFVSYGEDGWDELLEELLRRSFSVAETSVAVDESILVPLAMRWINYASLTELRQILADADQGVGRDPVRAANLLQEALVEKGPWGLSSFLKILDTKLEPLGTSLPRHYTVIPAMVKFGVASPVSAYLSGLGLRDRVAAQRLEGYFIAEGGSFDANFPEVLEWFANLLPEEVSESLQGETRRIERALRVITRLNSSRRGRDFIQTNQTTVLSRVMGLRYELRYRHLANVAVEDTVSLRREFDNLYDQNAILIANQRGDDLGYVRRDTAKIIAPFMDSGLEVVGRVQELKHPTSTLPWGDATIEISVRREL